VHHLQLRAFAFLPRKPQVHNFAPLVCGELLIFKQNQQLATHKVQELRLVAPEPRAGRSDGSAHVLDDAVSALVTLGYKRAEAKSAIDSLGASATTEGVETMIRRSLAVLFAEK
jgi:Holliday junction resolvasome RuvABC DNA-binding subunit